MSQNVHLRPQQVLMRQFSIPNFTILTIIIKTLLCSQVFWSKGLKGPYSCPWRSTFEFIRSLHVTNKQSKYWNCYFNPWRIIMFTGFLKVKVLRALKDVSEGSSSNWSKVVLREMSILNFEILIFILQGLLCFEIY